MYANVHTVRLGYSIIHVRNVFPSGSFRSFDFEKGEKLL